MGADPADTRALGGEGWRPHPLGRRGAVPRWEAGDAEDGRLGGELPAQSVSEARLLGRG